MDDDVKVCPECGAEYFAHIRSCAGCGVDLVSPGERPSLKGPGRGDGALVCVADGDYDKAKELSAGLDQAGFTHKILKMTGMNKCTTGCGEFGVFVHQSQARQAAKAIDDFIARRYPELKAQLEWDGDNNCPACGTVLNGAPAECPDCGLNLQGMHGNDGCSGGGCGSH